MKTFNKIFGVALAGLLTVGCTDLSTEPFGSTITADQKADVVGNDPAMLMAGVTGITANFYQRNKIYADAQHFEFGYPSFMLFSDSRTADMVSEDNGYNWMSDGLLWDDISPNARPSTILWYTMYNQIYSCNQVLASVDKDTDDATTKYYMGQAYGIRAFDYFTLVQMYQFNYATHKDAPGVPIITEENADAALDGGIERATVAKTYEHVLNDLNTAIAMLGDAAKGGVNRADKRYLNVAACRALRARIYLTMQEWDLAVEDADAVISSGGFKPYSIEEVSVPSFASMTDNSWVWGIYESETNASQWGLIAFPSHMGSLSYGYITVGAWRMINTVLYDQIPASDVRKGWFLDAEGHTSRTSTTVMSDGEQEMTLDDYIKERKIPGYTQIKFAPYNNELYTSTYAQDIPLIRIEEMYMIKAEAQAMGSAGAAEGAKTLQEFVRNYRDPNYTCTAASGATVQEAVWNQRRIEFFGEGIAYFDLMRLNKGIDRRGGGYPASAVFNIEADAPVMIYQIPMNEIEHNSKLVQNPLGTRPQPVADI